MNIVCIGAGYIGCVTASAFAALGCKTTLIDKDLEKINILNLGRSPIFEPGLDMLIEKIINKTLIATTSYESISNADVIIICVGTPSASDGSADLKFIRETAKTIAPLLKSERRTVIVNKSTVPIGTFNLVSNIISEESGLQPERDFFVVSNPEFLREGFAIQDVFYPDRIVIGTKNLRARDIMRELYEPIINRKNYDKIFPNSTMLDQLKCPRPVYFETDTESAELIKYASNAFLAVKISYINEIARFCEKVGGDALEVAKGMGLDNRIGSKFLQISSGWQGSCFPKDTLEIYQTSKKYGCELKIVEAAIQSNFAMHRYVVEKIVTKLKFLNGKKIGILGLTFKPNTDDARKTQAEYIIPYLLSLGASVRAHDPKGIDVFKRNNPTLDIEYCHNGEDVAFNADCILLLTHWQDFLELNWDKMYSVCREKYILDTRNFLEFHKLCNIGFEYEGIGRSIFECGQTLVAK